MLQKCSLEQYLELVKKNYFDSNHQPTVDSMQSYTSIAKFIIFFRRRAQKSAMASECRTSTCCATRPTPACGSTSAIAPTWCSRRRWTSTLSHRSLNKVSWTKPPPPPPKKKIDVSILLNSFFITRRISSSSQSPLVFFPSTL